MVILNRAHKVAWLISLKKSKIGRRAGTVEFDYLKNCEDWDMLRGRGFNLFFNINLEVQSKNAVFN